MPYTLAYNPELGIIEVTCQGTLTIAEARQYYAEVEPIIIAHDCARFLADFREAKLKVTTAEMYHAPDMILKLLTRAGIPFFRLKRAMVIAGDVKDFTFFTNAAFNRGQNTKLFQDINEARKWLAGK